MVEGALCGVNPVGVKEDSGHPVAGIENVGVFGTIFNWVVRVYGHEFEPLETITFDV